jgi:transposase
MVFDGSIADPGTLGDQVTKVKQRFGLARVVFVGDRGLVTSARIREDLQPAGLDWIPPCAHLRSRRWSKVGRCSYRCSMSVASPRSPRRRIRASA